MLQGDRVFNFSCSRFVASDMVLRDKQDLMGKRDGGVTMWRSGRGSGARKVAQLGVHAFCTPGGAPSTARLIHRPPRNQDA